MIAILMCTYNGEKYLREQLDSILYQDIRQYENAEEYRVYIVDDGSTDKTTDIIDEYVMSHRDMVRRLVVSDHHEGAKNNFFKGLLSKEIRKADYVMFSDQDDVWNNDKISTTLRRMKKIEKKCGRDIPILVHSDCKVVDQDLKELEPSFIRYANLNQKKATFSHLMVMNFVTGAASMLNRSLMQLITEIPESCMMYDHFVALVAGAFGKISFIDKPLYQYRQHSSNVLGASNCILIKGIRIWLPTKASQKEKQRVLKIVRENYTGMKLQAESFLKIYGKRLDPKKRKITVDFINLSSKFGILRVFTLLKNNTICDNGCRILGECSFFLRYTV